MAPRLAARTATLCILIVAGLAASAAADRRPVAVIALADDPQAEALANAIGNTLVNHTTLGPLEPGSMIGALVGEFVDENRDKIASAEGTHVRAEKELAAFSFPVAISIAQAGHESLHTVVPSTHAVALYADLALVLAKARLGEAKVDEAARFFGLVHQLTPGRKLDPALHLPEVMRAYDAARTPQGKPGTIVVKGSGRVWIDGKDKGTTTGPFELAAGLHVVWLTGPDRETSGRQILIDGGRENVVDLGEAPASTRLKVQRARTVLRNAPDPTSRSTAMRRIAELLDVSDAVLITMPAGKLIVQTWHDKAEAELLPGFSAHRLAEGEKPLELLAPLAPPLRMKEADPAITFPVADKPWYRRRKVQAGIVAVAVGVIAGSVILARELRGDVISNPNTSFVPHMGPR